MAAIALPVYETVEHDALPDHVTYEQAAQIMGCTASRVRQMVANGNFKESWHLGTRGANLLLRAEVVDMIVAEGDE